MYNGPISISTGLARCCGRAFHFKRVDGDHGKVGAPGICQYGSCQGWHKKNVTTARTGLILGYAPLQSWYRHTCGHCKKSLDRCHRHDVSSPYTTVSRRDQRPGDTCACTVIHPQRSDCLLMFLVCMPNARQIFR